MASPVFAGEHYRQVWNPPEARGMLHVQPDHKSPPHRRANVCIAHTRAHHRQVVATASVPKTPGASTASRARRPRFDDLPRQITPEGNVLRVGGRMARIEVEH
ncbi:hypothetical protein GCT13_38130 [Paraburkholderia sp. CNPSo 3157]|uniref:Uncharacterized protein n=1 Tax=Paraburkholderia franconis TaxID=2654983 RepID=A0A7X1NI94_9BURK|nr:hypothetical protein [Paraburkholderia franconis]